MELLNYTEAVLPNFSNTFENGELYHLYQLPELKGQPSHNQQQSQLNQNQTNNQQQSSQNQINQQSLNQQTSQTLSQQIQALNQQNHSLGFLPGQLRGHDDPDLDSFSPTQPLSFLSSPQYSYSSRPQLSPQILRSGPLELGADQPPVDPHQYPDMTSMINANSSMILPMVETTFVDYSLCSVCGKKITRDMSRHMRTHRLDSRFEFKFPKGQCNHKLGRFNRRYDFKKHLLNRHFEFDDPEIKKHHTLSGKLTYWGTCQCGLRFLGASWLEDHVMTGDITKRCPYMDDF